MATPLGDHIRARRDATTPESVGLHTHGRRRVAGLRRGELADLAGISVEYLARIEQGRDRNPSVAVVQAIADALGLDGIARSHLRDLAQQSSEKCVGALLPSPRDVRPPVRTLLRQIEPGLAYVATSDGDLLATTDSFAALAAPSGLLERPRPNLAHHLATDPRAAATFPDHAALTRAHLAAVVASPTQRGIELRAELADHLVDAAPMVTLAPEPADHRLRWVHPDLGELHLDIEEMALRPTDGQSVVALLPTDDATARALARLRPPTHLTAAR